MSDTDIVEVIVNGFAIYGLMWIIIFFLLLISHLTDAPKAKTTNPKETSTDDSDGCS